MRGLSYTTHEMRERGLTQEINIRASLGWQNHWGPAEEIQSHATETFPQPRPRDPSRKKINISQEYKFKKNDLNIYFVKHLNLFSKMSFIMGCSENLTHLIVLYNFVQKNKNNRT